MFSLFVESLISSMLILANRTVIGALGCGYVSDMIGRRYTVMIALAISFAAITME